jgi:ornithine carbamoyltransferase
MKKDLVTLDKMSESEIWEIFERAKDLKYKHERGIPHRTLLGKMLGMIFEKTSTRTRVSFEVGMAQLGGHAVFLAPQDTQMSRGEEIRDTARVLSRYVDAIMMRTYSHQTVEEMAYNATVPVINGLTDMHHPCQALADMYTIQESLGALKCLKLAYIGDGNNVANSLIEAALKVGMNITLACPEGYEPDKAILEKAEGHYNRDERESVQVVRDPLEAAAGANVLYADVWSSMGQEGEADARAKAFEGYQINHELIKAARPDVLVMHCLPAHRGQEITDDAMESSHSVVFDQAENRLHVQKAILEMLIYG